MAYYGKSSGGLNGDWVDLITIYPTASGNVILIQNRADSEELFVVFGGSKPTELDAGFKLREGEVIWGSGTSVWVRGSGGYVVSVMDKE